MEEDSSEFSSVFCLNFTEDNMKDIMDIFRTRVTTSYAKFKMQNLPGWKFPKNNLKKGG